jgi:hypothetical protein
VLLTHLFRRRRDVGRERNPPTPVLWDVTSNVGIENTVHELRDTYADLPPIRRVTDSCSTNTVVTNVSSPRAVKDITEAQGAEVRVCKPEMWQDVANRFPGLSLE